MDFRILETLILTCHNELDNTEGYGSALDALLDHLEEKLDNGKLPYEQGKLLDWLNTLISDRKAASLYLEHWQLGEQPNDKERADRMIEGAYLSDSETADRRRAITQELIQMGYPNPDSIVFDNEAMPRINWRNPNFDCTNYYETLMDMEQ